jgi:hypothetical protein
VLTNLNGFKHPALWPGPQVSGAASTVHRHAPVRCAGATARQRSSFSGRCRLVNCRTGPPPLPMSSSAVWPPHTTPPFLLFKHQADPAPSLFPSWLGWRSRRRRFAKIHSQPLEVLVLFQSEAPRPYSISRVAYYRSRARSSLEFVRIVSECHRHPPSW